MINDPHDCSTEDEGVDKDMMFEFEEELDARLLLDRGGVANRADASARSPFAFASESAAPLRPQNPVASVLQGDDELEEEEFASLSASPFCEYGSPAATMRMAAAVGSMSAPPACSSDRSPCFDFNGRRKRKYFDDSCCVTPRVRPLAKRAKSFSSVTDILLPSVSSFVGTGVVGIPEKKQSAAAALPLATGQIFSTTRSESIQIPHRVARPSAHQRSASGPARGAASQLNKMRDLLAASSDPMVNQASSWNASVEYFCRRSLDISSPLRIRFRDLVVGSVGRARSLQSP